MCKHQSFGNCHLQPPVPASDRLLMQHTRPAKWALRAFAFVMVLFLVLQSVLTPGQGTAERAHFHVARFNTGSAEQTRVSVALPSRHLDPPQSIQDHHIGHVKGAEEDQQQETAQGLLRHKRDHLKVHDSAHHHTHAAVHEHAQDRGDVAYVEAHESGSAAGSTPTLKRLAFDFEAVLRREPSLPTVTRQKAPHTQVALNFVSHTELPLERPPRTRAQAS